MPPGPPRTPTNMLLINGNPNLSRMRAQGRGQEPEYENIDELPPTEISESAMAYWRLIRSQLDPVGVLTAPDAYALAMLCEELALYDKAKEILDKEGYIVENIATGAQKESPWVGIRNRAFMNSAKLMERFGLTPADRSRAPASKQEPKKLNRFGALGQK